MRRDGILWQGRRLKSSQAEVVYVQKPHWMSDVEEEAVYESIEGIDVVGRAGQTRRDVSHKVDPRTGRDRAVGTLHVQVSWYSHREGVWPTSAKHLKAVSMA